MKIKDFNLPSFSRVLLNEGGVSKLSNKEAIKAAINLSRPKLNKEDLAICDVMLDSLGKDEKLPFELSAQEENFFRNNEFLRNDGIYKRQIF